VAKGYKQKESTLNKKVVDWLNSLDHCFAYKNKGGPSNPGHLDVSGCIHGIRIEIEGKVGNNKPTKLQWEYIATWRQTGAITGWYNSLDEAKRIVIEQASIKNILIVTYGINIKR